MSCAARSSRRVAGSARRCARIGLSVLAAMRPDARGDGWEPGAAVLAALGTAGRRSVRGWLATYGVTRAEGMVLMQGAVAIDRLSELRARDRSTLSPREDGMVQRLARVDLDDRRRGDFSEHSFDSPEGHTRGASPYSCPGPLHGAHVKCRTVFRRWPASAPSDGPTRHR